MNPRYDILDRADQNLPSEQEVRALAGEYGVTITSWVEVPMARLAVDGYEHIETESTATVEDKSRLKAQLEARGYQIHASEGVNASLFGVVGDRSGKSGS